MGGICDGLLVLEVGAGSIGTSIAGMVLADAGARVIKIEPPEGDRLRSQNPSGFLVWNRGKESLIADLHADEGQARMRELAARADVVLEGLAPGRAEAWGIGAARLCRSNPALVHCAFSAFGATGPYARIKGYDTLVAAKCGLWARGAFAHRDGPTVYPVPWPSFGAAMQAVAGVLGALLVRDRSGRGQRLEATMFAGLEPTDYFVATIAQLMAKKGERPSMDAREATSASRYGVIVATRDSRFIYTSTLLAHQGAALCEVAGIASILEEPRFRRAPMFATPQDAQAWEDLLVEAFRAHDLDYWLPLLEASPDVAFEVGRTSEEGLEHPQVIHNGDVITIHDETVGPIREVGPIGHFTTTPIVPRRSAPQLGCHHDVVGARPSHVRRGPIPDAPFAGVTIIEFGYFYAMPYALAMAAALGARVIKLEDANGDPHRSSFGHEVASNKTTAGKESVSLDLRTQDGRRVALEIIARADVFVTGFRAGVAERLGLGETDLRAANPSLLYVHAAGYGATGPYAHRALYAGAAQAVAGSVGRQTGFWADPARSIDMSVVELQAVVIPRLAQITDGDSNAALALLAALSLGIYHQQRTGVGQKLVTSMIAGNAWAYSDDFCRFSGKSAVPVCDDEYYGVDAFDRVYPAANGTWVCLMVPTERERRELAEALGIPELGDPVADDGPAEKLLTDAFASREASEWEELLLEAGVGCVAVNLQGQPVFTSFDPGLRESGLTISYEHPLFGEMVRAAPPVTFSETPGRVAPPCTRGEHNRAVLSELGYTDAEIHTYEMVGAVIPPA